MIWWIILLLLLFAGGVTLSQASWRRRILPLWMVGFGVWLSAGSFAFLPWITFAPWRYARRFTVDVAAEVVLVILEQAERFAHVAKALEFVSDAVKFINLSGWLAFIAMPSFNLYVRLAILAAPGAALLSLVAASIGAVSRSEPVTRWAGIVQAGGALSALVILITGLPMIDSWGTLRSFPVNLLPVFMGAELCYGVWVALLGLVVLVVSGVWLGSGASQSSSESEMDAYEQLLDL
jgi:hypothetical protein